MRKLCLALATMVGLTLCTAAPAAAAGDVTQQAEVQVQLPQAESPSPSLGSTPQSTVERPDDNDGNPDDFTQVPLVIISFSALALIILVSVGIYLYRRGRRGPTGIDDPSPRSSNKTPQG